MKLDEFKAWFEGFTEGMEGAPSAKQWKRIKERVGEIDGVAISHTVYVDRYWPLGRPLPYQPVYGGPIWNAVSTAQGIGISNNVATTAAASALPSSGQCFDSHSAMYAAGKAEALQ